CVEGRSELLILCGYIGAFTGRQRDSTPALYLHSTNTPGAGVFTGGREIGNFPQRCADVGQGEPLLAPGNGTPHQPLLSGRASGGRGEAEKEKRRSISQADDPFKFQTRGFFVCLFFRVPDF
ncbi:unnamed protein product, partial [Tetraodon nigroviridis]